MAAVSVDPPSRSAALKKSFGLPYTLLCDPWREMIRAWGLLNESELGGVAIPAVFVIDTDRTIAFRSVDTMTYQVKAADALGFVRQWRAGQEAMDQPSRSRITPRTREWWRSVKNIVKLGWKSPFLKKPAGGTPEQEPS